MDLWSIHEVGGSWWKEIFSERLWSYIVAVFESSVISVEIVAMCEESIFARFDMTPP
jgi:hypothetical protein